MPRACAQCPWRVTNQGTPHPHGFYTPANLRRLWTGLRTGKAPGMSCHPTDPRMADFEGYEHQADLEHPSECAGAVALVYREILIFQEICKERERLGLKDGLKAYRRARPKGLSNGALADYVWRIMAGGSLARAFASTSQAVNDPDIQYSPLGTWPETIRR